MSRRNKIRNKIIVEMTHFLKSMSDGVKQSFSITLYNIAFFSACLTKAL